MRFLRTNIIFTLLVAFAISAKPQYVDVDWSIFENDTLLPRYTTVVELDDDYELYNYSASIEYPEFVPMTSREIEQYRLSSLQEPLASWPSIATSVQVSAKKGYLDVCFTPVVYSNGKYLKINSFKLVVNRVYNSDRLFSKANSRVDVGDRYALNSVLASGRWVKISVAENGVYKITRNELKKMGFSNPDKVRLFGYGGELLPETNLHKLSDDLQEVPMWRESDYLLFYANGTVAWEYSRNRFVHKQNHYSHYSYYFLNESDADPLPFPKKTVDVVGDDICTTYPDYALYEKDEKSLCVYGRKLLDSYNYASGRTVSYKFDLPGVTSSRAYIGVSFGSDAKTDSKLSINVNDASVGFLNISKAMSSDNGKINSGSFGVNSGLTENTVVKLSHSVSDATLNGYLDYIELNFTRELALRGSYTNFRGASTGGNTKYKLASATNTTHVWQVTTPSEIAELSSSYENGFLTFGASASYDEEFVAVDVKGSFPSVTIVGEVANQNLHALGQTDMVIIVPSNGNFLQPAERLAEAHRQRDALTVAVVTAEQVYNEFSSGTPDATAYRRLMKMLYDRATSAEDAPKYLLLFGDGSTDNRLITVSKGTQENLLLTYQSENSVSTVFSYVLEDYFGFLDDNEGSNHLLAKVDIGIGRIPANTIKEANAVVDKTIAYMENKHAGPWQNIIALLGDDGDKSIPNQHMKDAEAIASYIEANHRSYVVDRIYWDEYPMEVLATGNSYPLVVQDIHKRIEEGALIMNYSGHGSARVLSHEMAWSSDDMASVSSPYVPFWVTASCDIAPFDMGDGSIGEEAILNPNGAGIGLFTTTRTVLQSYNAIINRQFMKYLLKLDEKGNIPAVGDAARKAKCAVISESSDLSENKLQYVLLGDPALRLNMPKYSAVIDKFDGKPVTELGQMSAGGNVTVEGYIANSDGSVADSFTGVISPTLYDCAEVVTTLDNTGLGAYNYTAFRKKLFEGGDSVKAGRFKLTIPVPMDISYGDEQGMLNIFAVDETQGLAAQGHYENFIIGGTAESIQNDGKGPEIAAYLNSSAFVPGGEVNATPCLFVELFDENGINTVGSGIGHDIIAIVDNDASHTYKLNSFFKAHVGDYRRGTVECPIGELSEGEHQMIIRAWDLFNNAGSDTINFVVVPNLAPDFVDISVSPNPIRYGEQAHFVLLHDRPQSIIEVTLELFNYQGQKLWQSTERGVCDGTIYTFTWDVTAQGGQPMPTGVYFYRAQIASGGGKSQTKTRKIIILNNK